MTSITNRIDLCPAVENLDRLRTHTHTYKEEIKAKLFQVLNRETTVLSLKVNTNTSKYYTQAHTRRSLLFR